MLSLANMRMAISAILCWIMPNSLIDLPNALRSLAYLNGVGEVGAAAAMGEGAELQPAEVQDVERDDVAASDFAEDVLHRHLDVVQIDGRGGAAFDAHLLFFGAGFDAGPRALHQERREFLAADLCEDRVEVRKAAVGDPHFLAVEDVVLAVLQRGRRGYGRPSASEPACGSLRQ